MSRNRWIPLVTAIYVGVVLLAPLATLASQLWQVGARAALESLATDEAQRALGVSLLLAVVAVVVNGLVGVVGALVISRHAFAGRTILDALADLPLAVSPVMVGLAFLLLFGREGGLQPLLERWHLQIIFAFPGLLVATLFVTLPYTLREVAYVLDELGSSEEEAATTLGANGWQTFWRVTLPNVRQGLAYGSLMTGARALGEFGAVLVLGGSIAGQTQTATTFIHDALEERDTAAAYGMAAVLAACSIFLLALLQRWQRRPR